MSFDFYIGRRYLTSFFAVFGVVFALVLTIDTIDVLGSIRDENIGLWDALWLSSLRVPDNLVMVFPLIVLISSMAFCIGMSRSSEFVIARAVGHPMLRTFLAPLIVTTVLSVFVVISLGPLAARLASQYDTAKAQFSNAIENQIQVTASGLWLRELNEDLITVINAGQSSQNGTRLANVTVFKFTTSGRLVERIEAKIGYVRDGELIMADAKLWDFSLINDNPELSAENKNLVRLPTSLTSDQVLDGQIDPKTLLIWNLPAEIAQLQRSGSSALTYQSHFFSQIALPINAITMFIFGAIFLLHTGRSGSRGLAVMGAVSLGFLLFFFQRAAQTFGEAGELQIVSATLAPSIAGLLGGIAWLLRKEDG